MSVGFYFIVPGIINQRNEVLDDLQEKSYRRRGAIPETQSYSMRRKKDHGGSDTF